MFEESGLDYGKADADAAFVTDPHEASLRLEQNFTFRQKEAHIEQSRETQRLVHAIEAHAAGAQIDTLHADFIASRIADGNRSLHARAEKLLLLVADEAQGGGVFSGSEVDVVFLELAAQRAAGDTELFGGESALAAGSLEGFDDHLLFHAVEIADGHGRGLTQRNWLSSQGYAETREVDLRAGSFHRHSGDEVAKFANIPRPGMREQSGNRLRRKILAEAFRRRKYSARATMSSGRSRRGGTRS